VFSDRYTRLGENGSPKRGRDKTLCFFLWNLRPGEELCVLSNIRSRSGEKSSSTRDEVVHPLLHARLGEIV